jgi:hypothetical protein
MIFCTESSLVVYRFAGHVARVGVGKQNAYKIMAKDTNYEALNFFTCSASSLLR